MMLVLDNSVAMRWFFKDGSTHDFDYASLVLEAIKTTAVAVPGIWALEVANALVRAEAQGIASENDSEAFAERLGELKIAVDPETSAQALSASLRLARRYGLAAYDACYLELALRKECPLATLDKALLRAAKRAGVARFDPRGPRSH